MKQFDPVEEKKHLTNHVFCCRLVFFVFSFFEGLTSYIQYYSFSFCHISHSELLQTFKPPAVMNVFLTNVPAYLSLYSCSFSTQSSPHL